ncbi:MAG: hypothetical protein AUF76_14605 [Acidobacteria bacterium 13_1_20CM_2_65_9]|nr:MAG: hypothetical protein AUF76_14605 [Acidobacteria bacterium 13_1_20CM_2_65_9]
MTTFLKTFADRRQLHTEVEALRAFGEERAVRVLEVRLEERAIILERVRPGMTLASIASEDEAMRIVAELLSAGWPPVPADSVATPPIQSNRFS